MNYEQQNYRQALTAPGTTPSAAWVSEARRSWRKDGVQVNPLALTLHQQPMARQQPHRSCDDP